MNRKEVIELEPRVACLKGHENVQPGPIVCKLSRRFYQKTITELKFQSTANQTLKKFRNDK